MIGFLQEIFNLFKPHVTLDLRTHNGIAPKARGIPAYKGDLSHCIDCKKCEAICPTHCIEVQSDKISFDYGACLQCSLCSDVCENNSILESGFVDVYSARRVDLKVNYNSSGILESRKDLPEAMDILKDDPIYKLVHKNGFNFREVCAGSNTGVEWEIGASYNNVFDMENIGVRVVASPKHADILLVSGPISENMHHGLNVAWDSMAKPRAIIAMGTEAVSGGLWKHGIFPETPKFWIAGDPPRPDVMIRAFLTFMGRRDFDFKLKWLEFLKQGT